MLARTCDDHGQKGEKRGCVGRKPGSRDKKKDSLACFLHPPSQGSHLFRGQIDAL